LHGGDDRLLGAEDADGLEVEMVDRPEIVGRVALGCLLSLAGLLRLPRRVTKIGAGAERLALCREHGAADIDVAIKLVERVGDLVDQRDIEEVERWAADFDGADVSDLLDADIFIGAHDDPRRFSANQARAR